MSQIVIINGRPIECERKPYLAVGQPSPWRTPIEINGKMVYGVNINGYDYPPAGTGSILYYPGLPGQGATIWDRSNQGRDGTKFGATWKRLPGGLWYLDYDGGDDYVALPDDLLSGLNYCTIEMWLYLDVLANSKQLFGSTWTDPFPIYIEIRADGNIGVDQGAVHRTTGGGILSVDEWFKLTCVKNATTWLFYRNEVFKESITSVDYPAIDVTTGHAYALMESPNLGRNVDGSCALFGARNIALSPAEDQNNYQLEKHLFGV